MTKNMKYWLIGCFALLAFASNAQQSATAGARTIKPAANATPSLTGQKSATEGAKTITPAPDAVIHESKTSASGVTITKTTTPKKVVEVHAKTTPVGNKQTTTRRVHADEQ